MAIEYGGSADGAPNPGVVDGSGDATLGGMIGGLFGGLSTAVQEALNIISGLVGIPAAQASNYSVVNSLGQSVGYLTLTGIQGLTLGQALAQSAAAIDISSGLVLDRNGVKAGFVDLESVGTGNLAVGPINIDEVTQTISTNTPAGVGVTAQVPAALALQLNSIDGVALRQTTRYWRPTTCSTLGVPILDYNNTASLFSSPPRQAFMHPAFIGGLDGIYSLHTGRRSCLLPMWAVDNSASRLAMGPISPRLMWQWAGRAPAARSSGATTGATCSACLIQPLTHPRHRGLRAAKGLERVAADQH